MSTRNVVLTDHHEAVIKGLVESGRYQNASEVLREGLRLLEQREAEDAAKLIALRAAAKVGFDDLDQGRYVELDDAGLAEHVEELRRRAAARVRKSG